MKPADHYRRAARLLDLVEQTFAAGEDSMQARAERLERLQIAEVHGLLGRLAADCGQEVSAPRPAGTRVVLTVPDDCGDVEGALQAITSTLNMAHMHAAGCIKTGDILGEEAWRAALAAITSRTVLVATDG